MSFVRSPVCLGAPRQSFEPLKEARPVAPREAGIEAANLSGLAKMLREIAFSLMDTIEVICGRPFHSLRCAQ